MKSQTQPEILQGTLALMILKTLEAMDSLHGYGIARRIEQTTENTIAVPYGTIYPSLIKLEQEGYICSRWNVSENNRRAKFYSLTRAGKKRVEREMQQWKQTVDLMSRFLELSKDSA